MHSGISSRRGAKALQRSYGIRVRTALEIGYKKIALRQQILFMRIPAVQEIIRGCWWLAPGDPGINLTQTFGESRSLNQSGNLNYWVLLLENTFVLCPNIKINANKNSLSVTIC